MSGHVPRLAPVPQGGMPGARGATGATGATGPDAPLPALTGANVYGRRGNPAAWLPVLPLAGGSAAPSGPMTGGIKFNTGGVVSSPLDLSRHIDLYGGAYGISATANALNYVSAGDHQFWNPRGPALEMTFRDRTVWFPGDWRWQWNPANGDLFYLDPAGNPVSGFQTSTGRYISWTGIFDTGHGPQGNHGIKTGGRGVVYYNIKGHGYNHRWDGVHIHGRVDNAVEYAFHNACDERLKQDIAPAAFDCLAAIRKVPLFEYRWRDYTDPVKPKAAAADAPIVPIGLVAQRLHEAVPELVTKPAQDTEAGAVCLWNAETNAMLAALCGAVQQLTAEIEAMGD